MTTLVQPTMLRADPDNSFVINPLAAPFNAVGNGVADDTAALQAALDASDESGGVVVDGQGRWFAVTDTIKLRRKNLTFRNFRLQPHASWVSVAAVYSDMGTGAGTVGATQIANRGKPLLRATFRDTPYTSSDFDGIRICEFEIFGNDVAQGMFCEGVRGGIVFNGRISYCRDYHAAALVKNGADWLNLQIFETEFGSAKQSDPVTNPYNSAGFVQTCPDILLFNILPRYCVWPFWADGFSNTLWDNLHPFNGNGVGAPLGLIRVGPDANNIKCTNLYADKGFIELRSFRHSFTDGHFVGGGPDSSNTVLAKLISPGAAAECEGLVIVGFTGSSNNLSTISLDETAGTFTAVRNVDIRGIANTTDAGSPENSYTSGKTIVRTIDIADWVANGSNFKYEVNLTSLLAFPNANSGSPVVALRDRRTAATPSSFTWWWRYDQTAGGTKLLEVFSTAAIATYLIVKIDEGDDTGKIT